MTLTIDQLGLILAMAAVLFLTRTAGIFLVRYLPESPRTRIVLGSLPGVTLISVVLPDVVNAGFSGIVAGIVVFVAVRATGNLGLAMLMGVAIVTVLR